MSSAWILANTSIVLYVFLVREKVRKEKVNTLGMIVTLVFVVVASIPLLVSLFSNSTFFDENFVYFASIGSIVLCAYGVTDIAFGTFSKPGTARKVPKKYPVWVWIASFVGAWAITLGVIFVTFMLASNY